MYYRDGDGGDEDAEDGDDDGDDDGDGDGGVPGSRRSQMLAYLDSCIESVPPEDAVRRARCAAAAVVLTLLRCPVLCPVVVAVQGGGDDARFEDA
jgi:hypothetical protein